MFKPLFAFHFKINTKKRIILRKGKTGTVLNHGGPNYEMSINNSRSLCKRGNQIVFINPKKSEVDKVILNLNKNQDIDELLTKHFGATWREKFDVLN